MSSELGLPKSWKRYLWWKTSQNGFQKILSVRIASFRGIISWCLQCAANNHIYLFTNEKGEFPLENSELDPVEVDQIYNMYMNALIQSYDKLKGRFNTFAAKCLSEKQKRESGLLLVAPPLSLPGDRDVIEQEAKERQQQHTFHHASSTPFSREEQKVASQPFGMPQIGGKSSGAPLATRMGAKQGGKMERVQKKGGMMDTEGIVEVRAAQDQTVRQEEIDDEEEDEAVINIDDEDDDDEAVNSGIIDEERAYTNRRGNLNPPKATQIDREPEREPELERKQRQRRQQMNEKGEQEQDDPPEEDEDADKEPSEDEAREHHHRAEEDGASLNISESNDDESLHEIKKVTAIPILKNNDKFKNKISKETAENSLQIGKFNSINQHRRKSSSIVAFSQRVNLCDPYQIAFQLMQDLNQVGSQIFQLWHKIIEIITINPKFICEYLRIQYEERMREVQGEHIYRTLIETRDFAIPSDENVGEIHRQIASKRRNQGGAAQASLISATAAYDVFNVIEAGSASTGVTQAQVSGIVKEGEPADKVNQAQAYALAMHELQPILFEEVYVKSLEKIKQMAQNHTDNPQHQVSQMIEYNYRGVHLFVLCHGFQGNSCDMRLLKNNIALLFPEAMFLCSSANEEYTEGDIFEMGVRLSQEVNAYINQYCPGQTLGRISFITHSLGGLIVRAALPYLEEHSEKMYNLITLSSAHLGYMYNQSKIIDAGMWFLKTWRKSKCLQQLRMTDSNNLEECALYKLSEFKGLNWFKHIVLVSSYQDSYAPFESARIQICTKATSDANKGNIYIKMARNLLSNLPIDVLYRIDVDFRIAEKNLDSFIGRTAHIQFLECQNVMKMLIYRFKEFFC